MKKPVSKPAPPAPQPEPDVVVEPPAALHKATAIKRMTEAEYTSRMKFTIIGSPASRGRA